MVRSVVRVGVAWLQVQRGSWGWRSTTGVLLLLGCLCAWPARAQSSRPGVGAIPYGDALGTGVTFRVWAPNATNVTVPGQFNSWSLTANRLFKEAGTEYWSADLPLARAGQQYKFLLNGSIWKRDPRGRKVEHTAGNSIVYDQNTFNWSGDARLPVNQSDLVIYELHVGAFYDPTPGSGGPGKFTDAVQKLDYLAGLGINAVELMPVAEFAGDNSWGYNPADPYAVENTGYGGPDGLKSFVKAAHARGIRVLLDVVHSHYGPDQMDLWGFDNGATPGIYFYSEPDICCTGWGQRPRFSSQGVRSYIIDNFRMWMDDYHLDGFRWDTVGSMRYYDPGHVNIPEADSLIQYINNTEIHGLRPGVISIAEDESYGQGFDGEWARGFGDVLIQQVVEGTDANRNMNTLWNEMNGSGFFRVAYTETHDLVGALNGSGSKRLPTRIQPATPDGYYARKRSMLAAAVVMTMPATPMLFMGQEMLDTTQFSDSNPLNWARTTTYSNVVTFYRDLIHLRRNLDGLSLGLTGPNVTSHVVRNDPPWKLMAFHRWGAGANDQVMVIMNFTSTAIPAYRINTWPASGNWYVNLNSDWTRYGSDFGNYGSSVVNVSGSSGDVAIGPYSVLILSRQAHPDLDSDGDGLRNGWEQQHFGDPLVAVATADNDGDGINNLQEQAADTDPKSAASVLRFTSLSATNGSVTLRWIGGQNARQVLQQAATLGGTWSGIFTNNPPTAITNTLSLSNAAAGRFYRIVAGQ
jgi:1,4-alpha-glucan branching enzyme